MVVGVTASEVPVTAAPLIVKLVAWLADQLRVLAPPEMMVAGEGMKLAMTGGGSGGGGSTVPPELLPALLVPPAELLAPSPALLAPPPALLVEPPPALTVDPSPALVFTRTSPPAAPPLELPPPRIVVGAFDCECWAQWAIARNTSE